MVGALQFSPESFGIDQHALARSDALRRLGLVPLGPQPEGGSLSGTIASVSSGTGVHCARIACGAQRLVCRMTGATGDLWLLLPLDGVAFIEHAAARERLATGEIGFGTMETETRLICDGGTRLLFVCLPRAALDMPLAGPGRLRTQSGIARIFATMLSGVADTIEHLDPAELRPVGLACTRFLSAALGGTRHVPLVGAAQTNRVRFQRICRIIEQRLGEPELSLNNLAKEQGVSLRYLQKLFESAGERFGHYVRTRRLERCRADLAEPALALEPVATIGFRWGFSDAAHFSRAFRQQFGVAPRAYRLSVVHEDRFLSGESE